MERRIHDPAAAEADPLDGGAGGRPSVPANEPPANGRLWPIPDQLTIARALRHARCPGELHWPVRPTARERLAQDVRSTEQAWLARKGFGLVTIPVALFGIGFIAVKVLPGLHRLHGDWGALLR